MADIHADILLPSPGAAFGFEGDLVHPLDIADIVAPQLDDFLCLHVALRRWLHYDFHVDKILPSNIGLNTFRYFKQVVLLKHAVGGIGNFFGDAGRLRRRGAHRQGHPRLNFVGRYFRHHDDAHVIAVPVAAYHHQQGDRGAECNIAVPQVKLQERTVVSIDQLLETPGDTPLAAFQKFTDFGKVLF